MSLRSVYFPVPPIDNGRIRITGEEHRHLNVARVQPGERIEVLDGKGTIWSALVEALGKHESIARIENTRRVERDSHDVILALALIRTAAFELALEKVVEVGVTRILPFTASRSNVPPGKRQDRWLRILVEAMKQSKHAYLPELSEPMTFDEVLSLDATSKIMFAERDGGSLKSALTGSPVLYLIGPEGGWTDWELSTARERNFHAVTFGAAILKAETAAIVGASLIRYELGK